MANLDLPAVPAPAPSPDQPISRPNNPLATDEVSLLRRFRILLRYRHPFNEDPISDAELEQAETIFKELVSRNQHHITSPDATLSVVDYRLMMRGYVARERVQEAVIMFKELTTLQPPLSKTDLGIFYDIMLELFAQLGMRKEAEKMFEKIKKEELPLRPCTFEHLMRAVTKTATVGLADLINPILEEALRFFQPDDNNIFDVYTCAIRCLHQEPDVEAMLRVYKLLREHPNFTKLSNRKVFNTMLSSLDQARHYPQILSIVDDMLSMAAPPTPANFENAIRCFKDAQDLENIKRLFKRMQQLEITPSHNSFSKMVTCALRFQDHEFIVETLKEMDKHGMTMFPDLLGKVVPSLLKLGENELLDRVRAKVRRVIGGDESLDEGYLAATIRSHCIPVNWGRLPEVVDQVISTLDKQGIIPNKRTVFCLARAVTLSKSRAVADNVWRHVQQWLNDPDGKNITSQYLPSTFGRLGAFFARHGDHINLQLVLDTMLEHRIPFTTGCLGLILDGFNRSCQYESVKSMWRIYAPQLVRTVPELHVVLLRALFETAVRGRDPAFAMEVIQFCETNKYVWYSDADILSRGIDALCAGDVPSLPPDRGAELLETVRMLISTAQSMHFAINTSILNAHLSLATYFGTAEEVKDILDNFEKRDISPDYRSFSLMLDYFFANRDFDRVSAVLSRMQIESKWPRNDLWVQAFQLATEQQRFDDGWSFFRNVYLGFDRRVPHPRVLGAVAEMLMAAQNSKRLALLINALPDNADVLYPASEALRDAFVTEATHFNAILGRALAHLSADTATANDPDPKVSDRHARALARGKELKAAIKELVGMSSTTSGTPV